MKIRIVSFIVILLTCVLAHSGVIEIKNNDSRIHVIALDCNGDRKFMVVSKSTTLSYVFHAKKSKCNIVGGTVGFFEPVLLDGESWQFKNNLAQRD